MDIFFANVNSSDAELLVQIRIEAMRESLSKIGRFDPDRARNRFLSSFNPSNCSFVQLQNENVGFFTVSFEEPTIYLQHLYILPGFQNRGIGSEVVKRIFARADALQRPIKVGALRESPSNRFYQRNGFIKIDEEEWDIYYLRAPNPNY